jgi:hypothetical protein
MAPQVIDSTTGITTAVDSSAVAGTPVPPAEGGNGKIFVSVVSYRGTNEKKSKDAAVKPFSLTLPFLFVRRRTVRRNVEINI